MRSKFTSLLVLLALSLSLSNISATAQVRRKSTHHGSFYLSGGMNWEKYNRPTIHVDQPLLGNSYDLEQVRADSKGDNKSLFPLGLNYRLGYYFDYDQKMGIELNFDPINYHITDGEFIHLTGTFDKAPVDRTIAFSKKNGYYYCLNGANLVLVNFVRRFTLYRPLMNKIGVDGIVKVGAGPALPKVESTFPGNSKNSNTKFQFGGWNAGLETALRVTLLRYVYLEFAAKYDYAMLSNLAIHDGTIKQTLGTFELIGSLGFTFPTNKFNPLFRKPHKIISILPFTKENMQKDRDEGDNKKEKKDKEKEKEKEKTDENAAAVAEIPEFSDVVDKKAKKKKELFAVEDSIAAANAAADSAKNAAEDSAKNAAAAENAKNAAADDTKNAATADSTQPAVTPENAVPKPDSAAGAEPVIATPDNESKKERKRKEKEEAKERKRKEKEELKAKDDEEKRLKAEEEEKARALKEQQQKELDEKDQEEKTKVKEEKTKVKEEEKTKEEEKVKEEKPKEEEDPKAKRARELEEIKAKREKEQEELRAKREEEKKDREAKAEQARKEREEKADQAKKEREEKLEQAKKEREEKLEQAKKEREEKLEQARKEREEKLEQARKEREAKLEEAKKAREEKEGKQ